MKDYDKNKEPSYLQYWDVNMVGQCPVNNFEKIGNIFQIKDDLIKKL